MSLWSVSEVASVNLVKSFFRDLKDGKSKSEALASAREEIRKKGFDHPFFWAGFILVGETQLKLSAWSCNMMVKRMFLPEQSIRIWRGERQI